MENTTNSNKSSSEWILQHDFILTIIIPSLLLFILLLVTIMIACILHRRHKKRNILQLNTEIFHPRSPVIFASEPGRHDDRQRMHKRLFSHHEDDDDYLPVYEDRRDVMENLFVKKDNNKKVVQVRQSSKTLARQVPPYNDSKGNTYS